MSPIIYEKIEGKRGIRIEGGPYMSVLSMMNGYQWCGAPTDMQQLQMLRDAIDAVLVSSSLLLDREEAEPQTADKANVGSSGDRPESLGDAA